MALLTMLDNKVKNVIVGNTNQQKCPFCGQTMKQAMHRDLDFASPEALELMCLSLLHFLLHILDHVMKLGYSWTVKKWYKSLSEEEDFEKKRRTKEINDAFAARGLPVGTFISGKGTANGEMIDDFLMIFVHLFSSSLKNQWDT